MYNLVTRKTFRKDMKRLLKANYPMETFNMVVNLLLSGESLPKAYKNHKLVGNLKGYMECHIDPDWILLYQIDQKDLILTLCRTGSHSEVLDL